MQTAEALEAPDAVKGSISLGARNRFVKTHSFLQKTRQIDERARKLFKSL